MVCHPERRLGCAKPTRSRAPALSEVEGDLTSPWIIPAVSGRPSPAPRVQFSVLQLRISTHPAGCTLLITSFYDTPTKGMFEANTTRDSERQRLPIKRRDVFGSANRNTARSVTKKTYSGLERCSDERPHLSKCWRCTANAEFAPLLKCYAPAKNLRALDQKYRPGNK